MDPIHALGRKTVLLSKMDQPDLLGIHCLCLFLFNADSGSSLKRAARRHIVS